MDFLSSQRLPGDFMELTSWKPPYHPERRVSSIPWPAYNEAQMNEKLMAQDLLKELCQRLPEHIQEGRGRPRAPMRDTTFCVVSKLYEGLSSRRLHSDLEISKQRGYVEMVPHFNTLLRHLNDPTLTPLLVGLIELSALPMVGLEETFAIDATGFSSAFYSRWLDERIEKQHPWIKIHLACGVKSGIVTAVKATDGHSNDCPHFPQLVRRTAKNFEVKEIMADMGYLSSKNFEAAVAVGATPYIPFKSNSTPRLWEAGLWTKLYHYFHFHTEEFNERYHQRSNVESVFSSIKRKFSSQLMLRSDVGKVNEALAMLLCYNLSVIVREIYESGISAEFVEAAPKISGMHQKGGLRSANGE